MMVRNGWTMLARGLPLICACSVGLAGGDLRFSGDGGNSDRPRQKSADNSVAKSDTPNQTDLLSIILAGIQSCSETLESADFDTQQDRTFSRDGKVLWETKYRFHCVFDHHNSRVRQDVDLSDLPTAGKRGKQRSPASPTEKDEVQIKLPVGKKRAFVIRRTDVSAEWIEENNTLALDYPEKIYDAVYMRVVEPLTAGLLTPGEVWNHEPYSNFKRFIALHRDGNAVVAKYDGKLYTLIVRYKIGTVDGSAVETERQSWIDPVHFAPVKTQMRQRSFKNGTASEWSSPQLTEVKWTQQRNAFVPVSIVTTQHVHSNRVAQATITITWNRINEHVNDDLFDCSGRSLPKGTMVLERRIDGGRPVLVQKIGSATPAELVAGATLHGRQTRLLRLMMVNAVLVIAIVVIGAIRYRRRREPRINK